ncbi:FecR family protein [Olivibacter sp. XZL3]|uniref:FecR family protein n=1 Tax=Olivibacter sp. XZL3 TaxID=1735116 RepID=UPI0010646EE8|nr:FecR family protein [Olivibacter sp. XZL3]
MSKKKPDHRIEELAHKLKIGTISDDERLEFDEWFNAYDDERFVHPEADNPSLVKSRIYNPLLSEMQKSEMTDIRKFTIRRLIAAASVVAVFAVGSFIYLYQSAATSDIPKAVYPGDKIPTEEGTTLTLSDGKKIKLNQADAGELAKEAGIKITKTLNGQLNYEVEPSASNRFKTNTLSTAKGETYCIQLPDGSRVWINAASNLTYSTAPDDHGFRWVKLDGEAYFEVAKDEEHPFIVETEDQHVKVLGTSFNIQAYANEPKTTTTLITGSVVVEQRKVRQLLRPGEQSICSEKGITVKQGDMDEALSWRLGDFVFNEQTIAEIMRTIARWYDVEVFYHPNFDKHETFSGQISRSAHISEVLTSLQSTGKITFKMEGRKIVISN